MNFKEVVELVSPSPHSVDTVISWMTQSGIQVQNQRGGEEGGGGGGGERKIEKQKEESKINSNC